MYVAVAQGSQRLVKQVTRGNKPKQFILLLVHKYSVINTPLFRLSVTGAVL